jgi:uncharacterized damage-inducible protein DinB
LKSHIERMLQAMAWADERVIGALRDCPDAHDEALPLLSHLLAAEHVWLARLERRPARVSVWPTLSLPECVALAAENAAGYVAYLKAHGEAELAEIVVYKTTQGVECATAAIDVLTHVVIHGAYHRGQIAKALGRAGTPATNTDYITFVREMDTA